MNIKLFCFFLFLNFNQIFCFRCQFYDESVNYFGYSCDLSFNSSENSEVHLANKSDENVKIVTINGLNAVEDLSFNQTEPQICQKFINLHTIIIKNGIKSIAENFLQNCSNLREFFVNNTNLPSIHPNTFQNTQNLTWLSLTNSKFTTFDQNSFKNLKKLKNLSINKNQIKTLPPKIFSSLDSLEMLWMDHNKLGTLNANWFDNLRNLESLNLGVNGLLELPKNIFKNLINLQFLFLHGNKLVTVEWEAFPVNGRLNTIDLSYNKIESIDEKFVDFTYVYWIDMMGNVCSREMVRVRSEVKEKLKKCLENYRKL